MLTEWVIVEESNLTFFSLKKVNSVEAKTLLKSYHNAFKFHINIFKSDINCFKSDINSFKSDINSFTLYVEYIFKFYMNTFTNLKFFFL